MQVNLASGAFESGTAFSVGRRCCSSTSPNQLIDASSFFPGYGAADGFQARRASRKTRSLGSTLPREARYFLRYASRRPDCAAKAMKRGAKSGFQPFSRSRTSPATLSNGNCAIRAPFVAAPPSQLSISADLSTDHLGMSKRLKAVETTLAFSASVKRALSCGVDWGMPTFARISE